MCSAETPIKTDRVKEDKKVSLEEKLELLEDIMDYDDALKPEMVLADLEEWDSLSTLAVSSFWYLTLCRMPVLLSGQNPFSQSYLHHFVLWQCLYSVCHRMSGKNLVSGRCRE